MKKFKNFPTTPQKNDHVFWGRGSKINKYISTGLSLKHIKVLKCGAKITERKLYKIWHKSYNMEHRLGIEIESRTPCYFITLV